LSLAIFVFGWIVRPALCSRHFRLIMDQAMFT
jgi:hypothetical protein